MGIHWPKSRQERCACSASRTTTPPTRPQQHPRVQRGRAWATPLTEDDHDTRCKQAKPCQHSSHHEVVASSHGNDHTKVGTEVEQGARQRLNHTQACSNTGRATDAMIGGGGVAVTVPACAMKLTGGQAAPAPHPGLHDINAVSTAYPFPSRLLRSSLCAVQHFFFPQIFVGVQRPPQAGLLACVGNRRVCCCWQLF
jgi:hypothetical protein